MWLCMDTYSHATQDHHVAAVPHDLNYLYSQMCLLLHLVSVQSFRESKKSYNYRIKYIITS